MIVIHGPLSERLHGCNWRVTWGSGLARRHEPVPCQTWGDVMQAVMLIGQQMEAQVRNSTDRP